MKQTTRLMLSATGAAAARTVRRTGRLLALLLLAPFYVAGWGAAAVIVAGRHVRAAVITGWEDVAGPALRVARATQAQARTPEPGGLMPARLKHIIGWMICAILFLLLLALGLFLWVGFIRLVVNG